MSDVLMPPNATPIERALAHAISPQVPTDLDRAFNPDTCPSHLLAWLAHALSVDVWEPLWSDEVKRRIIRDSVLVHRKKGTIGAVRRMLASLGHPTAEIIEKFTTLRYNGTVNYDGSKTYAPGDHWAEYRVILFKPVSIKQAEVIREALALVAPTRSHLKLLDFRRASHLYDGATQYDGTFSHGAI
jgi:phage tail P2-like protein